MVRILGKDLRISKSATMVAHDVLEDLSSWEFANPSDDEHEDSYSFTDDDESDEMMLKEDDPCETGSPSSDISFEKSSSPVQITGPLLVRDIVIDYHDNLVPNWLSDKFERQRIRKLGKRA